MVEVITKQDEDVNAVSPSDIDNKLAAAGWGLFFIWIGLSFLMNTGVGVTLLGVGIITLCMQFARKLFELKLEGVWLVIGLLLVVGGVWELLAIQIPLTPVLLIVAGVALLFSILRRKTLVKKGS
jgi:hypothetical protein